MELQQEQTEFIKKSFALMKSKDDFLSLINFVKVILYAERAIPFEIRNINFHSNPKANLNRYIQFPIRKKSGKIRTIHAPCKGLKEIQKCLNFIFQTVEQIHPAANGFVPGKSIVDNAKIHAGSYYVYNIDLKDFFPSIESGRIYQRLQHPPFNLNEKTGRKELANIITWLCCHEMEVERLDANNQWQKTLKNVLPQGAPTSPALSNIVCKQLDYYLSAAAKRFGLKYSRYADDITFSSMCNVFQKDSLFVNEIHRIISAQHFHIKESKTRLQKEGYRKEVTGLLVNEKPNVQKRYIKQLRMWLYYWESYGYERANSYFLPQYKVDKGHTKKGKPNLVNVMAGKLDFLKMVKGSDNELYLKLKKRFEKLTIKDVVINNQVNEQSNITEIDSILIKDEKTPQKETEGQIELILRPAGTNKSIKLLMGKFIPEGIVLPYHEVFKNTSKEKNKQNNKQHDPHRVIEWLNLFSNDNSNIKFSTHIWDEELYANYGIYIQGLNDEFIKYKLYELQKFSSNLYWEKIYPFLFQKVLTNLQKEGKNSFGWGRHKIRLGWQFPNTIKTWCKINFDDKGKNASTPYSMEIPDEFLPSKPIGGKTIKYFEDIVNVFKDEIEFRDNKLYIGVKTVCMQEIPNHNVDQEILESLKGCSFYTNTEYVLKAISRMLRMIRSRSESQNVNISCSLNESTSEYSLDIVHINSYSDKELTHPKIIIQENSGDLSIIRTTLTSLCDFAIESRFKDGDGNLVSSRIEYLYKGVEINDWQPRITKINKQAEGFKFILKFPVT